MKIYGDKRSGNCYKIELTATLLGLDFEWVDIDMSQGEHRTPSFLAKSPAGKIPIVEFADGRVLSESNAIINYLAHDSEMYPAGAFTQARIQQWQFFEQYSHEPYIAVARFIQLYLGLPDDRRAEYDSKQAGGYRALDVMEHKLSTDAFLCGDFLTTADVSLYAYTHVAHEGGFDISAARYPALSAWMARIASLPHYVSMNADA